MTAPLVVRTLCAPPLTLEPLGVQHAREMFAVLSDPAIYEFENEPPASEEALARRYARLERRTSDDGRDLWLNWVVRLPDGALAGYVQATVEPDGTTYVAYQLASRFWRQGIGSRAVAAMLDELRTQHGATRFAAVLKARNHRSLGLLCRLGFVPATAAQAARLGGDADEIAMTKETSA